MARFTRPFTDYVVDDFLGLWHGVDFHAKEHDEAPPEGSLPVLYHLLHAGPPPPNVVYFGFTDAQSPDLPQGFYANGWDLPSQTPITE
ncbi:MAG: hypothetical protein M5U01_09805 [Ardenticatenaceae bacterium]|nr:hypothetical protein [Ardenticatenaceae bacterium]